MFLLYDPATGRVLQQQSTAACPDDLATIPAGDIETDPEGGWYVSDGEVLPRPPVPAIPRTGTAPLVIPFTDLADAYTLTVANEAGDSATFNDLSEPLTLTDAGRYRLHLEQPFPHQTVTLTIEVTDA